MWLAIRTTPLSESEREALADESLILSPEVTWLTKSPRGASLNQTLLIHLGRVWGYWKLDLLHQWFSHPSATQSPFLIQVESLKKRFPCIQRILIAPTAPWTLWALEQNSLSFSQQLSESKNSIEYCSTDACRNHLSESKIHTLESLLPEESPNPDWFVQWEFFLESLQSLGIRDTTVLKKIPLASLTERFGPWMRPLIQRFYGADNLSLNWFEPTTRLEKSFSPEEGDLLESFRITLESWSRRLAGRRSLLKGVRVRMHSDRSRIAAAFFVQFPRPTQEVATIFPILKEKWLAECGKTFSGQGADDSYADTWSQVILESMGLERAHDAQIDLFHPERAIQNEAWSNLVARLQARSTPQNPIQFGTWVPQEDYLPEHSFHWKPWQEQEDIPFLKDHPTRPLMFLNKPRLKKILPQPVSEDQFLDWVTTHGILSSLERILSAQGEERLYARVDKEWVFWSHQQQSIYTQGFFESPP
jgi:hypothetical protein